MDFISMERVTEYIRIESERSLEASPTRVVPTVSTPPPKPVRLARQGSDTEKGRLTVRNLRFRYARACAWRGNGCDGVVAMSTNPHGVTGARYGPQFPEVLHGLSFEIPPGAKVAVVGRTGSGKSSLFLSCLRLYPFEGSVALDGKDLNTLSLRTIRRDLVCAILQDSQLLGGTIRSNLFGSGAPGEVVPDHMMWDVLASVGLKQLVEATPKVCGAVRCFRRFIADRCATPCSRNLIRWWKSAEATFLQASASCCALLVQCSAPRGVF